MTRDDEAAGVFVALRADLLRGDLGRLGSHLAALESIMDALPGVADEADLTRMRGEAERSRDVLAAAAGGVRAALRRLGEAGAPSTVYAPDGTRRPLGPASASSESRA